MVNLGKWGSANGFIWLFIRYGRFDKAALKLLKVAKPWKIYVMF